MDEMELAAERKKRVRSGGLLHALIAILCALILLTVTSFSIFRVISPLDSEAVAAGGKGGYIEVEIERILGIYAEEYNKSSGEAISWYAIVPVGDTLITVILPKRYFDSAQTVYGETGELVRGDRPSMSQYFTVRGTLTELNEEESLELDNWFNNNKVYVALAEFAPGAFDYSEQRSVIALKADEIGGYPQSVVYALSVLAAVFVIYALIAFVLSMLINPGVVKETAAEQASTGEDIPAPQEYSESGAGSAEASGGAAEAQPSTLEIANDDV